MTKKKFWELVAYTRCDFDPELTDGNLRKQADRLEETLHILSLEELHSYYHHFLEYFFLCYTWEHWDVIRVLADGCSNDGFDYFRAWMISAGEVPFHAMLSNADNIADFVNAPGVANCPDGIDFLLVSGVVYRERTEDNEQTSLPNRPTKPHGTSLLKTDPALLQKRFPKSWALRGTVF